MYYRNTTDIILPNKEVIDAGSLFRRENNIMVLVDEDHYITVPWDEKSFITAEEWGSK
ncbi:hypothetical protein [Riemerella anatipestifer]|uniref:hypothetical protein n=1 Tax=Riemerella anatipestifer TaxID=34085 RepID=UPI002363CEB9|nr:hypothetical protein [Riemerella anatipestifer]